MAFSIESINTLDSDFNFSDVKDYGEPYPNLAILTNDEKVIIINKISGEKVFTFESKGLIKNHEYPLTKMKEDSGVYNDQGTIILSTAKEQDIVIDVFSNSRAIASASCSSCSDFLATVFFSSSRALRFPFKAA